MNPFEALLRGEGRFQRAGSSYEPQILITLAAVAPTHQLERLREIAAALAETGPGQLGWKPLAVAFDEVAVGRRHHIFPTARGGPSGFELSTLDGGETTDHLLADLAYHYPDLGDGDRLAASADVVALLDRVEPWLALATLSRVAASAPVDASGPLLEATRRLPEPWASHGSKLLVLERASSEAAEFGRSFPFREALRSLSRTASERQIADAGQFMLERWYRNPAMEAAASQWGREEGVGSGREPRPEPEPLDLTDFHVGPASGPAIGSSASVPRSDGGSSVSGDAASMKPPDDDAAESMAPADDDVDDEVFESMAPADDDVDDEVFESMAPGDDADHGVDTGADRFFQTRVFVDGALGRPERRMKSFRAGRNHEVEAWIGPPEQDAHAPREPIDMSQLDPGSGPWQLRVHFEGPGGELEVEDLELPAHGPTDRLTFAFIAPNEPGRLLLCTFVISYKGKGMHVVHLEGSISDGADVVPEGGSAIAATQARDLVTPSDVITEPDLSIFTLEHNLSIEAKTGKSGELRLADIDKTAEEIRDEVGQRSLTMANEGADFTTETGLELLRSVAAKGYLLLLALKKAHGALSAPNIRTVHVLSQSASDWFPAEFLYDRPKKPLSEAALCTKFAKAVEDRDFEHEDCDAIREPRKHVCPLGFWGLSKVIERRVERSAGSFAPTDEHRPRPSDISDEHSTFGPMDRVVFGATERVNTMASGDRISAIGTEMTTLGIAVTNVTSWDEWVTQVSGLKPPLLAALVHTDEDGSEEMLEIGPRGEWLGWSDIDSVHVGDQSVEPGPLVLLLGCSTLIPSYGYQDVVRVLRDNHASIVVATTATTFGRQTAPALECLVGALVHPEAGSFGEVFRIAKADLVAGGNPMALALTAFGDSEWKLHDPTAPDGEAVD